jgi:hypothetical protein
MKRSTCPAQSDSMMLTLIVTKTSQVAPLNRLDSRCCRSLASVALRQFELSGRQTQVGASKTRKQMSLWLSNTPKKKKKLKQEPRLVTTRRSEWVGKDYGGKGESRSGVGGWRMEQEETGSGVGWAGRGTNSWTRIGSGQFNLVLFLIKGMSSRWPNYTRSNQGLCFFRDRATRPESNWPLDQLAQAGLFGAQFHCIRTGLSLSAAPMAFIA